MVEGREVGVEPICAVLRSAGVQIAPSGYYATKITARGGRLWHHAVGIRLWGAAAE